MARTTTVLYDSLCPVCRREVGLLARFDRGGMLRLVDITSEEFDPADFGLTMEECIGAMHGFDPDGRPLEGMDTIRAMYAAVGLGWLMAWTKLPLLSLVCDAGYRLFARWRPRFSDFDPSPGAGRCRIDRGPCRPDKRHPKG